MTHHNNQACKFYAAAFSPLNDKGGINLEPVPNHVNQLIDLGIDGFYLMGSTGEGFSMTLEQRKQITECYAETINRRVKVMVNVSHTSYEASIDLTRHAIGLGVDAISATLPSYYEINSLDQLICGVQKIADCQDDIPFLYYHIPGKTGINFKMHHFLEAIHDKLPQLGGIKYTALALDDFILCKHLFGGRYKMFFGADELFLPALSMGADAFIGSTYNYMLPFYQRISQHHSLGQKDKARETYFKIARIINTILEYDPLAAQKAVMKMTGHDFGIPKSPVQPLSEKEYLSLFSKLEEIQFLEKQEY